MEAGAGTRSGAVVEVMNRVLSVLICRTRIQPDLIPSGGGERGRKDSRDSYGENDYNSYRGCNISEREESRDLELSGSVRTYA